MATSPTPMQTLILWALVAEGGSALQKDLLPTPTKPDRDALVGLGLLQSQRGKRGAVFLELTDRGWAWAAANFAAPLSRSTAGSVVLGRMLGRLGAFLAAREIALAEFISPALPPSPTEAPAAAAPDLAARIRAAYLAVTGGGINQQVRLADIRQGLAEDSREAVDAALIALERSGGAGLLPLEDPTKILPADREAVLLVGGRPRHLLWLTR